MKEIREARRERDKEEEEEIRGTKRKKRRLRLYVGGYTAGCTRVLRKDDAPCDISTIDGSLTTHLLTFCSPSFLFCPISVLNEIRLLYSAPPSLFVLLFPSSLLPLLSVVCLCWFMVDRFLAFCGSSPSFPAFRFFTPTLHSSSRFPLPSLVVCC